MTDYLNALESIVTNTIAPQAADTDREARYPRAALDLADLAGTVSAAQALVDAGRPIDILVNNAGVMIPPSNSCSMACG